MRLSENTYTLIIASLVVALFFAAMIEIESGPPAAVLVTLWFLLASLVCLERFRIVPDEHSQRLVLLTVTRSRPPPVA